MSTTFRLRRPGGVTLAVTAAGPPGAPAAVLAHGAGSSADFVLRAFGPALRAAGHRLVAYDLRGHGASTPVRDARRLGGDDHAGDLAALAAHVDAVLLGGVSLGAHVAAVAAVGRRPTGVILALPAWTGPPDQVAAANAVQADELDRLGVAGALARIRGEHPGWVADELAAAWPRHDPAAFAAVLRTLARSPAPSEATLARIGAPAAVVALAGDPMHPAGVARRWAAALPAAVYAQVRPEEVALDREALGRGALAALASATRRVAGPPSRGRADRRPAPARLSAPR